MSNSIWKTPEQKPDVFKPHRILVIYEAHDEPELMFSPQYDTLADHRYVNRWCYWDEFIAQADKAERLQKENEAMREEFEVWHGNHKCVLEDKERLQKAVDYALQVLDDVIEIGGIDLAIMKIKQMIKENQ
jgi:hypothetical protein